LTLIAKPKFKDLFELFGVLVLKADLESSSIFQVFKSWRGEKPDAQILFTDSI